MNKVIAFLALLTINANLFANISFAADYAIFQTPENQPYVEFYLSVNGNTIAYAQQPNQLFQANIELTYLIEKGDSVIAFEKVQLKSPEYTQEALKLDMMDLKRLAVKPGDYTYTIIAKDLIGKTTAEINDKLRFVKKTDQKIGISEIQLADQLTANTGDGVFVKNGFDIIPNVSHIYSKTKNELVCYFEIYHADKTIGEGGDYLVDLKINDQITDVTTADLRSLKRMKAAPITPVLQKFNLAKLPSGDYYLLVEVRNRNNELVSERRTPFIRINPGLKDLKVVETEGTFVDTMRNAALLAEHIKSLRPISSEKEKVWADNQLKYAELEFMQRYFLNFWKNRNQLDPAYDWFEYKKKVEFVDREFGYGNVNGYTTDRGRVYLQYGAPNSVQNVKYDSDNHPYSIWQYYKLNGLTDRKFVFYSPTNEMLGYEVLHSNVPGEQINEDWEYIINKKIATKRTLQEQPDNPNYQRRAQDLFDNPR